MKFTKKIIEIGDSLAVTLPKDIVEKLDLAAGDIETFEIHKEEGLPGKPISKTFKKESGKNYKNLELRRMK